MLNKPCQGLVSIWKLETYFVNHAAGQCMFRSADAVLNLDIHRFEDQVLRGAAKSLANFVAIFVEASPVPPYAGQNLCLGMPGGLRAHHRCAKRT